MQFYTTEVLSSNRRAILVPNELNLCLNTLDELKSVYYISRMTDRNVNIKVNIPSISFSCKN